MWNFHIFCKTWEIDQCHMEIDQCHMVCKTCGIGQSPMFCKIFIDFPLFSLIFPDFPCFSKTCGIGQSPCGIGQSPMFCKFFMFYNELYSKISLIISECYSHPVQKVGLENPSLFTRVKPIQHSAFGLV